MSKNICGKQLGRYEKEACYKEFGHEGFCYKTFGLEVEAWIQELLSQCDCAVVDSTDHEDYVLKIDFWVRISEIRCNSRDYIDDFLPIQFTTNKEAFYGLKGQNALKEGVIIIFVDSADVLEWKRAQDPITKDVVRYRIYRGFCEQAKKVATCIKQLHRDILCPTRMLSRFRQLESMRVPIDT